MSLPYAKNNVPYARDLRKHLTPQERKLWYNFLRSYPVRFQRQKPVDFYIPDFYCHAARLVIELDGSQHYEPEGMSYDEARTAALEKYGLTVLRFSNADINSRFDRVCESIDLTVKKNLEKPLK